MVNNSKHKVNLTKLILIRLALDGAVPASKILRFCYA